MGETSGEESKEDHNVYLFSWQFQALDRIAEKRGVSRNQVLRDILKEELKERKVVQDE